MIGSLAGARYDFYRNAAVKTWLWNLQKISGHARHVNRRIKEAASAGRAQHLRAYCMYPGIRGDMMN